MSKVEINKCTIADLEGSPNFVELLADYAKECAIRGLPHPSAKVELYKVVEKSGTLQVFSARIDGLLIGFLAVLHPVNLHYGVCLAVTESLFVGKEYRSTGAGLKLIRAGEDKAKEVQSPGYLISAPLGSDLEKVLEHTDYEPVYSVFLKQFNKLATVKNNIPAMSDDAIAKVYKLEEFSKKLPQVHIETDHVLHGGVYARTIMVPAGVMLTGALVKIATTLIINGDVIVYLDGEPKELCGYNVLAASANRKQAFLAKTNTHITMIFATDAKDVQSAEEQFTDEAHLLFSRKDDAINHIMLEEKCLVG